MGDEWGEVDNRFTFCAVACLSLLGKIFSNTRSNEWYTNNEFIYINVIKIYMSKDKR